MPERHAQLSFDGTEYVLPVAEPTIGNPGLGIGQLRNDTGAVTFDPGFANTAGARSSITKISRRTHRSSRSRISCFSRSCRREPNSMSGKMTYVTTPC